MAPGKLIVIEGSDGSGKTSQLALLKTYFKSHQIRHKTLDFPQYYKTFFGRWIGKFLKGEFGNVDEIPPQLLLFPYAADRWQAKDEMLRWLDEGYIVLTNRYTGSNAAYQSAKLPSKKRQQLIDMSFEMEYEAFGIPREDLVIFLHVPTDIAQDLIEHKTQRKYLGKNAKKDIHESDLTLLRNVEESYVSFCKTYKHWVQIDCTKNGNILGKEQIHEKIVDVLKKRKMI